MNVTDLKVGKQLVVGLCPNPIGATAIGVGPAAIRGAAYIEGPVQVGNPFTYPLTEANLMVARCVNIEAIIPPPPSIFQVSSRGLVPTPLDIMHGDPLGHVGITAFTLQQITFNDTFMQVVSPWYIHTGNMRWDGFKIQTGTEITAATKAQTGSESRTGSKVINGSLTVNGPVRVNGFISWAGSIVATTKHFDIEHPTKDGHRLRHGCLEGPEDAVYCRGKVGSDGVIHLPSFWKGFVDIEGMTVTLTPIGSSQELFVKETLWGKQVIVRNNAGGPINAHYYIVAKRLDVPDLTVEYEGEYPGGEE